MTSVDELASALNDPSVKTQRSLSDLYSYIVRNHYRTTINGVAYYHSSASFGINQPAIIEFTELDLPRANNHVKIVLKDQAENVVFEREVWLQKISITKRIVYMEVHQYMNYDVMLGGLLARM